MPDEPTPDPAVEPDGTAESLAAALHQQAEAAEATAEPTAPAEPAVAPPAAEGQPAEPAAEPSAAEPAAEDDRSFSAMMDEHHGLNLRTKYQTEAASLSGLAEAYRMVGRRDSDAEYGRAMRQHEGDFHAFLQQKQQAQPPQQPSGQPAAPADLPSRTQIAAWRDQVSREGENAPIEARLGLEQFNRRAEDVLYELTAQPGRQQAERQERLQEQQTVAQQAVAQHTAAQQQAAWITDFEQRNAGWIYHGGQVGEQNLTADGQRLMQYARGEKQRGRSDSESLHYAHQAMLVERLQQQQQPQAPAVQPVKPAAQHQPAVAAPAGGDPEAEYQQDLEKFGGQPDGLANHWAKLEAQKQAAAGQLG